MDYTKLALALAALGLALAGMGIAHAHAARAQGLTLPGTRALACVRLPLARRWPLERQSARRISRFCCLRTPERTLLLVRLRTGRLYCLRLERSGRGEGARWTVRGIEGEERGALSAQALRLARRGGV